MTCAQRLQVRLFVQALSIARPYRATECMLILGRSSGGKTTTGFVQCATA